MKNSKIFTKIICMVCGKEMYTNSIGRHLKLYHSLDVKSYYDKFLLKSDDEKVCNICGQPVKFNSILTGYNTICNKCCGHQAGKRCLGKKLSDEQKEAIWKKIEATSLRKYGTKSPNQAKEVIEKQKATLKKHYGVDHPSKSKEILEKMRTNCLEKYGVEYVTQTKDHIEKVRNTNIKKYGDTVFPNSLIGKATIIENKINKYGSVDAANKINANKSLKAVVEKYGTTLDRQAFKEGKIKTITNIESIRYKMEATNIKKYGHITPLGSKDVHKKIRNINLKLYGNENILLADSIKSKIQSTNLKKYGCISPLGNDEIKTKKRNTFLQKYGYDHPPQKGVYLKDDIKFDSSWEIIFYEYMKIIENKRVSRNTTEYFTYIYNNEPHKYYPDFKIDDKFYEVKGSQFIKSDGNLTNPFDKDLADLFLAKGKCLKDNNVILISKNEIDKMKNKLSEYYNDKNWYKLYLIQDPTETHKP